MHIEMYLPESEPRAKLRIFTPIKRQVAANEVETTWEEDAWFGETLEDAAREAGFDLGSMNEAWEKLYALGVEEVRMQSYTRAGNDTNDPAKAKLWHAYWRHPNNSGHTSHAEGGSPEEALLRAVQAEVERQRNVILWAIRGDLGRLMRDFRQLPADDPAQLDDEQRRVLESLVP